MRSLALIFALAFAFTALPAGAQETMPGVKVDFKRATITEQPTPQFSAGAVKEKRWRPKNWIEMDVEFAIKVPADAGGNKGTYSGLKVNIFIALQHRTKEGKVEVVESSFDLGSVPAGEDCHVLAYISPAAMRMIFQKDMVTASSDITAWGVEFWAEGKRIEGKSSTGNDPWWETKKDSFAFLQGMLLPKSKTPFGILWGDYDIPVLGK